MNILTLILSIFKLRTLSLEYQENLEYCDSQKNEKNLKTIFILL